MTSTNEPSAPSTQREQQRTLARQWAQGAWAEPCDAIFFHRKRFSLEHFTGRAEFGTMPLWYRVSWIFLLIVLFPIWFVYGWIRQGLDDAGITKEAKKKTGEPGVISVTGSKHNPSSTSMIDTVKRAPRSLWIVFSNARLAIVTLGKDDNPPRVVWQTDQTASLRFHHAAQNSIEIIWPDRNRVFFYPAIEEREIVTRFVRSTWNDPR